MQTILYAIAIALTLWLSPSDALAEFPVSVDVDFAPGPWLEDHDHPLPHPDGEKHPYGVFALARDGEHVEIGRVVAIPEEYTPIDEKWRRHDFWYWNEGEAWPEAFRLYSTANKKLPHLDFVAYEFGLFGDPDDSAEVQGDLYLIERLERREPDHWVPIGYLDRHEEDLTWYALEEAIHEGALALDGAELRFRQVPSVQDGHELGQMLRVATPHVTID